MIATLHSHEPLNAHILHAVIGVWYRDGRTFFVKRSDKMENYPGAWSLFSIQYHLDELPDSLNLAAVQRIMDRMSAERLFGAPVRLEGFLTAGVCTRNPINKIVNLRLYGVEMDHEPNLNPDYYVDAAWMTADEYAECRGNGLCGSCLRLWWNYLTTRQLPGAKTSPP